MNLSLSKNLNFENFKNFQIRLKSNLVKGVYLDQGLFNASQVTDVFNWFVPVFS